MNRSFIVTAGLGAVAAGIATWWWLEPAPPLDHDVAAAPPLLSAPVARTQARTTSAPSGHAVEPVLDSDDFAWIAPSKTASAPAPRLAASQARMAATLAKLEALQADGNVEPHRVVELLKEIEETNGSPLIGNVRVDVLRHNLEVAEEMRAVAEDVQAEQAASGAAADQERVKAKLDRLQQLQKQIRQDFLVRPGQDITHAGAAK